MTVKRNEKGQIAKGQALNPAGRPRNVYARLLAEMKQKEFVEMFYGLLGKTTADLKAVHENPDSTNLEKISARLVFDCLKGSDPAYVKILLALLGININGPANILLNNAAFEDPENPEMKDVGPKIKATHLAIVEAIEKIHKAKTNE